MAASVDGKIAPAKRRAPFAMSRGTEDAKRMRLLRARTDAVVIGAGNLRADDPDLMPSRLRVVVTRTGEQVLPSAKMLSRVLGGEAIVAHASAMSEATRAALRPHSTLVELGEADVDVLRLLAWLQRERGCGVVLCEGGGVLNARFFAARAVDEVYVTVVPRILGGSTALTMVEGDGFEPDAIPNARLAGMERIGDELFLVYRFDWSAQGVSSP
jgi:riboflavin-specific deaminase-like protein